jgi:predicted AAA+ superfamily ATPase
MQYIKRDIFKPLTETLKRGKSVILLGPRQTGKTTLVSGIKHDLYINLMNTKERIRYESNPAILISEAKNLHKKLKRKPMIIIDEIQKVPELTDNIQVIIDNNEAIFVITGSSARKIKNLLPGRVIKFNMYPLSIHELTDLDLDLETLLSYGSLPGILDISDPTLKEVELDSYVNLYLEEEIRKEALVRNVGAFSNFLQLAALESGNLINLQRISQDVGVARSTIAEYYQILIDCMLADKIEPLTTSTSRHKLTKSPKYIFFDLGVRMLAAKDHLPTLKDVSHLFEQFIGLELLKLLSFKKRKAKLLFWRDHAGPEIDYVLYQEQNYIPIEVKWSTQPTVKDTKHLQKFMQEYKTEGFGYIICRTPRAFDITERIMALPWQELDRVL